MVFNNNGKISFHKTKDKSPVNSVATPFQKGADHNRRKNYIINEGDNIPVFIELGIFTKEFKIINSMYNKFKQINRFIELFDDMSEKLDEIYKKYNKINVIDFGCGKSYLTFILYYYFINVKKFPEDSINITGIDIKEKVVENCNSLAKKYNYKNLSFEASDIKNYTPKFTPNVVVSLHGCDTLTDYVLYNAITWQSDIIFAAPCCEHEINAQINIKSMRNILKYGIIKERFSAMLTNSIRCNILEIKNYKTELIEFVDITHSPKNLLIRAVGRGIINEKSSFHAPYNIKADDGGLRRDLEENIKRFEINQTLYNLLDF
jgi:SAM-dependent methyltransferase